MSAVLHVILSGVVIGEISQTYSSGPLAFQYTDAANFPLSPALPLQAAPYRDEPIRAFLEGLLPESAAARAAWARDLGTSEDAFDLLSQMGQDCAGAVQFAEPDQVTDVLNSLGRYEPVSDRDVGARLRQLKRSGSSWTMPNERWSLAGAQEKFTLAWIDGGWHQATGSAPSTHIIKPGVLSLKGQAAVEHATMRVAAKLGLPTARTELRLFDGESAVVVERFDRAELEGRIIRLHQVDLCQAMGRFPRNKYEENGGPTTVALGDLIGRESSSPGRDVVRFSDAVMFNYVSGAPDGHAKNYALIFSPATCRLAPLYDVASGFPYDQDASGFALGGVAMSIGGRRKFGQVVERHFVRHARDLGLDPGERLDRLRGMVEAVPDAFADELRQLEALGAELGARMTPRLARHCSSLNAFLARTGLESKSGDGDEYAASRVGQDRLPKGPGGGRFTKVERAPSEDSP